MKSIILVICILIFNTGQAQDYRFGKVSKEELQEKFNPLDSTANAAYLYKYRKTYFYYDDDEKTFLVKTEVHERIKLYNNSGFEEATKDIFLYNGNGKKENVKSIKARTYNLIDGKVEDTKLKNNGMFETEINKNTKKTSFTMPNIKEGSIVEWEYEITSPFKFNIDAFRFQESIPIKKLDYTFEAPEYYIYKSNFKGYLNIKPQKRKEQDEVTVSSKSIPLEGGRVEHYENDLDFTINIDHYNLENISALKDEPYVNNIDNYRATIKYEMSNRRMPNGDYEGFSTSWEDVIQTIYESSAFGDQLDESKYFSEDIDALLSGVTDDNEKILKIFNFVKSKVKWNGYYSKYANDGVKEAYKNQTGNSAEINLMLTGMLRYAEINANPILISTRDNGIPFFPTLTGYNYVACGVEVTNDVILLDATSIYNPPNILPERALNWKGRIIRSHGSTALVDVYPKTKAITSTTMNVEIDENGKLTGMIRNFKTKHKALTYRENFTKRNKDDYIEHLENTYGNMLISEFEVKNELDLSKPIIETFKFELENQTESINEDIYIKPLFFLATSENPFKLEKREFPIDFVYPSNSKFIVSINIPEGYTVANLPEPMALAMPDNLGTFKYNITANEKVIQLSVSHDINTSIISPGYYEYIKTYFKKIIEKENEHVVLKKV